MGLNFKPSKNFVQKNNPAPVTGCGRRRMSQAGPLFKKEEFKPHMMYKKDKEKAETYKEHLKLKEDGYDHTPFNLTDASYEKSNRKMRSKYTSETGKKLGKRLLKGKNKRRVSFACRFGGMKGPMKDSKGRSTRKAKALKKWGFGSVEAARSFCKNNKKK